MLFEQISTVEELKEDIKGLKAKYMLPPTPIPDAKSPAKNVGKTQTSSSQSKSENKQQFNPQSDCKYNLVIFGIDESSSGTNRSERVKHEVESSVSLLSKINSDINSTSI